MGLYEIIVSIQILFFRHKRRCVIAMKTISGTVKPECSGDIIGFCLGQYSAKCLVGIITPQALSFKEFGTKPSANACRKINTEFCCGKAIGFGLKN